MGLPRIDWWLRGEAVQNLGDYLSSLLADELFLPVGLDAAAIHVIGSVIDDDFLRGDARAAGVVFWGGGCRDDRGLSVELRPRAQILSVRGPRSRAVLGLGPDVPLGDPAFLLPALVDLERASPRTRGRTVVVPHFHDDRPDAELLAASGADAVVRPRIAATREALLALIDDIASADLVLSASLHAAIVAMAYDVPFAFWESGRTDLPFKWQDTAELIGVPATFVADVDGAREWWEAHARERLVLPPLLDLVAVAPFLVRPDALLRIVRHLAARTAPTDLPALLDRAVDLHAAQRSLVDAIARDQAAFRDAAHQLAAGRERRTAELDQVRTDLARTREDLERARADLDQNREWLRASEAHRERLDRALALGGPGSPPPDPDADPSSPLAPLPTPLPIEPPGRLDRVRHRSRLGWVNPLFDARWYAAQHPDVGRSRLPPTAHYVRHGRTELRRPNEHFDPVWYLEQHPDVRLAGMDPVDHWWFHGAREGRDPGPEFDTDWYLAAHPDVRAAGVNPLLHWLRWGRAEGRPTRPRPVDPADPLATQPSETPQRPTPAPEEPTPPRPATDAEPTIPGLEHMGYRGARPRRLPPGAVAARVDPTLTSVPLVIDAVHLERSAGSITLTCPLGDGREVWARVHAPDAMLDRITDRLEPFIPAAVLIAGVEGRPLRIARPLDPTYVRRLRLGLLPLVGAFVTDQDIVVLVDREDGPPAPPPPMDTVGLMFSGGVDSLHTLRTMQREGWPPHLLINVNAGGADLDRDCWARRLQGPQAVADELGIPLVTIDTNLHEVVWVKHALGHPFRNLGAASILQPVMGTLVYSAGHRLEVLSVADSHELAADLMETLTTEVNRWGGMELHLVGSETSRAYELEALGDMPLAWRSLDVCTDQRYQTTRPPEAPANCGRCVKCARTVLILEHLGTLDRFGGRFDLVAYETARPALLERIAARDFPLDNEARAVLAAPPGTLPPYVRGWPAPGPDDPPPPDPDAAAAPDLSWGFAPPRGATVVQRDPARADVPLVLEGVSLDRTDGRVRLTCPLGDGRAFWIEVDGPAWVLDVLEPRLEPFIPPAMLLGLLEDRPVQIVPPLDPTYARRLRQRVVPVMSALLSDHDVQVLFTERADVPPPAAPPLGRRALLYSNGVDSTYSLHRMLREGWPPDLLVNINAGGHDVDRAVWKRRLERIRGVGDELDVPVVTIDTNLHELGWVSHAPAHMFRNGPAASVLRPATGTIVYSSGHRLESTSFPENRRQNALVVEPVLIEAMRWGGAELLLLGNDVRRMDKVAELPLTRFATRYLDICVDQGYQIAARPDQPTNCGRCFKCARTLVLMEHLGILDRFAHLFDLAAFETAREDAERWIWTVRAHQAADARWLLSSPAGTVPPFRRGWLPPLDPAEPIPTVQQQSMR